MLPRPACGERVGVRGCTFPTTDAHQVTLAARVVAAWYAPRATPLAVLLWPLSLLFRGVVALRRFLFRAGVLRAERVRAPVVVIGNVSVGGTGKTPLASALAAALAARGLRPGIVSRGHGGSAPERGRWRTTTRASSATSRRSSRRRSSASGSAATASRRRARCSQRAVVNVVISDDGLQHYRLARNVEIAVSTRRAASATASCCPPARCASPRRGSPKPTRSCGSSPAAAMPRTTAAPW